jgi:hypothetical protein
MATQVYFYNICSRFSQNIIIINLAYFKALRLFISYLYRFFNSFSFNYFYNSQSEKKESLQLFNKKWVNVNNFLTHIPQQ